MAKVKRTYMIDEELVNWIDDFADEHGVKKSFIVKRAILFYRSKGVQRDNYMQQEMTGKLR